MPHRLRLRRVLALAVGGALVAAGCFGLGFSGEARPQGSEVAESPVGIVTHRDLGGGPTAIVTGTLVVDGGCVMLQNEGGLMIPSFPAGTRAWIVDGRLVLADAAATVWAAEGDDVRFGGGYDYGVGLIRDLADVPLPPACERDIDYALINSLERIPKS